jgi:predicted metal-dependent phosphoesterase TrpH
MNRADLHAHTTASDGTFSPAELVAEAQRVRLDVLAISDHDSTEGIAPALLANRGSTLRIIPAIEINCDIPDGEVHMLGYFKEVPGGLRPPAASTPVPESGELAPGGALQDLLRRLRAGRYERAKGMADKMNALGMPVTFERIEQLAGGGSIGRPHVARAIVEAGHAYTIGEAFERYIGRDGPAYVERMKLSPAEAAQAISASGGAPVLAHPYMFDQQGTLLKSVGPDKLLPGLVAAGLRGIETYYYRYPTSAITSLLKLAAQYHLLATGGSDFHGSVKPGQGLGSVYVPWDAVEALLSSL